MNAEKQFWDSNIWVYLFVPSYNSTDAEKQRILLTMLVDEPDMVVSVQVLNEVANVLMKKYKFDETKTKEIIDSIDHATAVLNLTKTLTDEALVLKKRYNLSWYDSLIVAAALSNDCTHLFTEDLQHGMVIEGKLTIQNPFLS